MSAVADIIGVGTVLPAPEPTLVPARPEVGEGSWPAYRLADKAGSPDFPARRLRRLGRAQAMALSAVKRALGATQPPLEPDLRTCVCVGTGWAEIGDEVLFLTKMIEQGELGASPTKFANSVHNALASQLALEFGWSAENHTFTHSALSFEAALTAAWLLFRTGRAQRVVACGIDSLAEFLEIRGHLLGRMDDGSGPLEPLTGPPRQGTIPGEGGGALILAPPDAASARLARVEAVRARGMVPSTRDLSLLDWLRVQAADMELDLSGVDLVLLGANQDVRLEGQYRGVVEGLSARAFGVYRHRTGDFDTASAVAAVLGVRAIQAGAVPEEVRVVAGDADAEVRRVLLVHQSLEGYRSLVMLGV